MILIGFLHSCNKVEICAALASLAVEMSRDARTYFTKAIKAVANDEPYIAMFILGEVMDPDLDLPEITQILRIGLN